MKRMALPVIGALICLQFTAGCLETGRSGSPVRTTMGKNNSVNAKKAQQMAKESAIPEQEFVFAEDDAYRNYIDPVVSNIKANGQDSIGLERVIKARKWTTLSLYNKSIPATVYLAPRIKDATIAWVSDDKMQISKIAYDSYLVEDKGKILMRLLVSVLRLETKGELKAYLAQALAAESEIPSEIVAELEKQEQQPADANTTEESFDDSEDAVAAAVAPNTRKPLPVLKCDREENANLEECVKKTATADDTKRGKLLTDEDKKNIELAADYLLQNGRSGKIAEITAKLKELTIIK